MICCDQCDGRLVVGSESVRVPASEYCRCEALSDDDVSLTKSERAAMTAVRDGNALLVDSDDLVELQAQAALNSERWFEMSVCAISETETRSAHDRNSRRP